MKTLFLIMILASAVLAQDDFNFNGRIASPRTQEKERCIELVENYGEPPISMKPWTFKFSEWTESKEAPKPAREPDDNYIWVTYADLPGARRVKAILTIEESKALERQLNEEKARNR